MEWLSEHLVVPLLSALMSVLLGWQAYDRKVRDRRFDKGDVRMQVMEARIATLDKEILLNGNEHDILQIKVDSLRELIDTRLSTLSDSIHRIEQCVTGKRQ